jgi:predicted enzyme related to lactoylglutathione lyase
MLKKIRTAIYHVNDINAAKNWYTTLLGIEPYFDAPFYVGFTIDGNELGLDPDYTNIQTGNNTYALWSVDNIDATVAQIVALGGIIQKPIETVGENMRVATLLDPWQNCIGLIEEKV